MIDTAQPCSSKDKRVLAGLENILEWTWQIEAAC